MPPSYARALIIPIPKNRRSANTMDYRPIALLQTSYKLFAIILAQRLQPILAHAITPDQQGVVRSRLMARNVEMVQVCIQQEGPQALPTPEVAPGILLVGFRKAYDTVDREYMLAMLREHHHSPGFIDLIERMHSHTTARFLVIRSPSQPINVTRGIRQGCALASLLLTLLVRGRRAQSPDPRPPQPERHNAKG